MRGQDITKEVIVKPVLWIIGILFLAYVTIVIFLYGIQFLTSPFVVSLFNISPDSIEKMESIEKSIVNITKVPIRESTDD